MRLLRLSSALALLSLLLGGVLIPALGDAPSWPAVAGHAETMVAFLEAAGLASYATFCGCDKREYSLEALRVPQAARGVAGTPAAAGRGAGQWEGGRAVRLVNIEGGDVTVELFAGECFRLADACYGAGMADGNARMPLYDALCAAFEAAGMAAEMGTVSTEMERLSLLGYRATHDTLLPAEKVAHERGKEATPPA